jgi:hypothetical protein
MHKGVLTLRFIRANEHRAIAIGLPYVLEGLLPTKNAQECALVYNNWRLELSSAVYKKSPVQRGQAMAGVSSMETLGVLGATLQAAMNALNAEVKMFNRQSANGDEDDTETVASGSSRQPRDMDVDVLACSAEDNVYATSNQREQSISADDKITGLPKIILFIDTDSLQVQLNFIKFAIGPPSLRSLGLPQITTLKHLKLRTSGLSSAGLVAFRTEMQKACCL